MEQPDLVLTEFRRVLRPGGIAVLAEPDWGTLVIDGGRADVAACFVRYTCAEVVRNATIGREVARLGVAAGFAVHNVVAFATVIREFVAVDKIFGLTRNAHAAAGAGYLTLENADAWLGQLQSGPTLATLTLFSTTLIAPDR